MFVYFVIWVNDHFVVTNFVVWSLFKSCVKHSKYIYIPLGNLPDIGKCEFETGGFQGKAHNLKKKDLYNLAFE